VIDLSMRGRAACDGNACSIHADYERDLAARGASEEFTRARQSMHTLLERFERHLQQEVQ